MTNVGIKRKLDETSFGMISNTYCSTIYAGGEDDPTLIEECILVDEDSTSPLTPTQSPLIYFDQGNTPPRDLKKIKQSSNDHGSPTGSPTTNNNTTTPNTTSKSSLQLTSKRNSTSPPRRLRSFDCNFKATKGLYANVSFVLKNVGSSLSSKMEEQIVNIISNPILKNSDNIKLNNNDIYLEIKDFASDESLSLYKDLKTNQFFDYIPQFEVCGKDEQSRYILCYLKGMLVRKNEIAVVPIPGHTHQILVFDHTNDKSYSNTSCSLEGCLLDDFEFDTKLSCIIVPKFVMALDLDETLIRTRALNAGETVQNNAFEFEFSVQNQRYCCCVRPGTQQLLSWCCTVFQVYIFTNSIFEYAREICKILDPQKQHLLANVNVDDMNSLKTMLKSREDMTPHEHIPKPLGMKDLKKFSIDAFETVIFDDDSTIWKQQECVLPFAEIVQHRKPLEFFTAIRTESWKKLQYLHNMKLRLRKKHEASLMNHVQSTANNNSANNNGMTKPTFAIPDRPCITLSQEIALNGSSKGVFEMNAASSVFESSSSSLPSSSNKSSK
ncbi:hypothetical protein C9374_000258 [Naegleria lovaniensis]|uniref:Mitochondrial import inner membrane translocase subunit TIM50 n=1 Tax=Naegleria lovaniensis TaxID=51637 RepID=A0AA88H034_NAELO|nr:uncharacterized protein C9374_000258 [Naegleria lovaniensis]KAG2388819.1 hypothetical protein C9374_000258 [Naegleria lovaniensis]